MQFVSTWKTCFSSCIVLAVFLLLGSTQRAAAQARVNLYFEAVLRGTNEVPPVTTGAMGNVYAMLNGNELFLVGRFSELSSNYTASHIHLGEIGTSGDPIVPLNPELSTDQRSGLFGETVMLTDDQVEDLLEGDLYINVHSATNAGGEIRGQLLPAESLMHTASLSGDQEVPPVQTQADGFAVARLTGTELAFAGSFDTLTAPYTMSHIHLGLPGESGPPVITLEPRVTADSLSGVFPTYLTISLMDSLVKDLLEGRLYVNVHSHQFPNGEIRGQLNPNYLELVFNGVFSGANVVPVPVNTPAHGNITAVLVGDVLRVSGNFGDLSSNPTAVEIRSAAVGVPGQQKFTITPTKVENRPVWFFSETFTLTDSEIQQFLMGNYHINVLSESFPNGELRAQLTYNLTQLYHASLSGAAVVPPVTTTAEGRATGILNGNEFSVIGSFSGLAGDFTIAEVHFGGSGETGAPFFTLHPELDSAQQAGVFIPDVQNTFFLTDQQLEDLRSGRMYLEIRSATEGNGELRGQFGLIPRLDAEDEGTLPDQFKLHGNYPNPFNPTTTISFNLPSAAEVSVEVYNLVGQRVLVLPERAMSAGIFKSIEINGSSLPSGVYLYRVIIRQVNTTKSATGRMVLLK